MSFRKTLALALLLSLSAACGRKESKNDVVLQLSPAEAGCLTAARASAVRYLGGQATEDETARMWDCAGRALQLFTDYTRGETPGVYTARELRAFLRKYFLKGLQLPDGLLREIMEVKRVVVGGSVDSFTVGEIQRLRQLLQTFRSEALRLRPFMPLSPSIVIGRTPESIDAAAAALEQTAQVVGGVLQATGVPYSWARLDRLLAEIEAFPPPESGAPIPVSSRVRAKLKEIQAVKGVLFGRVPSDRIAGDEWSVLLAVGAQWYGIYLQYLSFYQRYDSWERGAGREALVTILNRAFELVDQALARNPGEQLDFARLDELADLFLPGNTEIFGGRAISNAHLKPLLRPVIRRVLGGAAPGRAGREAGGLTRGALRRVQGKLELWSASQAYLERLFDEMQRRHRGGPTAGYSATQLNDPALERLFDERELTPRLREGAARMRTIIARERPLFQGDDGNASFGPAAATARHSAGALAKANWMFILARALAEGYAEEPARARAADDAVAAVNEAELGRFVEDIRAAAADMRFLDPADLTLAGKRFLEASLFTYPGNGDALMDVRETAHLLALMISAKLQADETHAEIAALCHSPGTDPFGYPAIEARCYRERFFAGHARNWRRMPGMDAHYADLLTTRGFRNEWVIADFEKSFETAARKKGYSEAAMDSSDSEGFAALGQYIEVVFAKFDTDASGFLDYNEAVGAYPAFKDKLKEMTCAQGHCLYSDRDLTGVFTYLLAYGKAPSGPAFLWWLHKPFRKNVYADRSRILQIFAMISTQPQ